MHKHDAAQDAVQDASLLLLQADIMCISTTCNHVVLFVSLLYCEKCKERTEVAPKTSCK